MQFNIFHRPLAGVCFCFTRQTIFLPAIGAWRVLILHPVHMYLTVFNSSAHNYCPVLLIITQKCNSYVLYLHIHNHVL